MRPIHTAHLDKARPVLVLTRELVLPHRQQVTVAPITTTVRGLSTEVPVGPANGIGHESVVSCDNIVTIGKEALGDRIGYLFPAQELLLTAAIHAAFGLEQQSSGSSLNVARCYAALREAAGQGETGAFPASEVPARHYDHMVYVSRTGTTTEVLDALRAPAGVRTTGITADPGSPLLQKADAVILLDFSAERSVVSSRFITSTILLLRAHLGEDLRDLPDAAARELARPLPPGLAGRTEFTFLGLGWAAAVADEAALKLREASRTWAESYPAMEYRHGPISVSDSGTVVWALGQVPSSLLADARRTGAMVVAPDGDPLLGLTGAPRLAAELAARKHIDPDQPRALARSVILA